MKKKIVLFFLSFFTLGLFGETPPVIKVGSKIFPESYLLAEIVSQIIEETGEATVQRRFGLGQTGIAYEALRNGQIDLYPEYTGTIAEVILKKPTLTSHEALLENLIPLGLTLSQSLGFNNTYAIATRSQVAKQYGLKKISDLNAHPTLRAGFSHEFLERQDGYPRVAAKYHLNLVGVHGIAHGLSYEAIARGEIDLTDIYSTDAMVQKFELVVLEDDLNVFPDYQAVFLARLSMRQQYPKTWAALCQMAGKISAERMIQLNAQAELDKQSFSQIARAFLHPDEKKEKKSFQTYALLPLTRQHLALVGISLLAALIFGLPLAVLARESRWLAQVILIFSGLVQTIPSLALLCFLIPCFGIGTAPALVALFLYGLLPIVRNTYMGLTSLDPKWKEVSQALGLSYWQRLFKIEIPLASPSILAGIRTSAIINVGTTTLAALIGAGGYGVPIVTGLALNDNSMILQGAIPAAVLALAMHGLFELLERWLIPKGIR